MMREAGAVYMKVGAVEVTLGPAPVKYEEPKEAAFVHDEKSPGETSRRNPLLDHPSLRR